MAQKNLLSPERRAEIFAKEVLTTSDLEELFCVKVGTASKIMQAIKAQNDRLKIAGVVHIQDYIDYYNLDISRYIMLKKERLYELA